MIYLPYLLMLISISFTTLNGTFLHKFSNRDLNNSGDIYLFNGAISLVWSVILFFLAIFTDGINFNLTTFIFGLIYAIILCAYQLFKCLALSNGPISLTTLIANCAFLITTGYAFFIEKEKISLLQLIGIIFLLAALFLCLNPRAKNTGNNMKITARWLIFAALLFLSGGGVGIIYRLFGKSDVSQNATSMLLFAALISAALFIILAFCSNLASKKPIPKLSKTALKYALLCGATGCIYIRMNLSLSAIIPPVIFFPASNGLTVILSSIVGWILFKEKLPAKQICGILIGLLAIILIGCF